MTYATLTQTRGGLQDPATLDIWDFVIPGVPSAASTDGRDMAVLCQNCEYPGRGNEIVNVPLHGTEFNFRGRATMPRTLSITYAERYDLLITHTMMNWFEFQAGSESGLSQGYKAVYAVDGAILVKYDTVGVPRSVVTFYGLQPEDMPNASLDGASSSLWTVNMSFRYDFYRIDKVQAR